MQVERIHHAAIMCSDYERTKRFYIETLGFDIVRENYTEASGVYKLDLAVGGQYQIEIFYIPNRVGEQRRESAVLHHLALQVADVAATAQELRAQGIAVDEVKIDPWTGKQYTFFADPDGVPLELYQG